MRYTERDEFGNAKIVCVDNGDVIFATGFKESIIVMNAIDRLAELEDKLESGELIDNSNNEYEKPVHCRDCKHQGIEDEYGLSLCDIFAEWTKPVTYCSYGEKKEVMK